MSGYARVDSVDALKSFRQALVKFAETANTALADAEGEMNRTLVWLETEQHTFWTAQIRKRHDDVERCKDAVRQKKLYKSPTGSTQSAVEEEKLLKIAQRRLEEAETKLKNVKRYTPRLQKEISIYKGGVQRLSTTVSADIPVAISRLDKMLAALQAYAALSMAGGQIVDTTDTLRSMARAVEEMLPKEDYSPLRLRAGQTDRAKTKPGQIRLEMWSDGLVSEREREFVRKIEVEHVDPPEDWKVIVEKPAWQSQKIFLERVKLEEHIQGDSGWHLGRADGGPVEANLAVTVRDLVEARPDLREILALPTGHCVVIDVNGIVAILNQTGSDLWPTVSGQ
jgi:hypothetical protein